MGALADHLFSAGPIGNQNYICRKMTMSVCAAEGNKPRHVRDQYHSEALGVTITLAEIFQ